MKKSLFRRAVAAVAVVPLALTQCLTYSFAATDGASDAATESGKTFSLTGYCP